MQMHALKVSKNTCNLYSDITSEAKLLYVSFTRNAHRYYSQLS
jgi:hypothetical protein